MPLSVDGSCLTCNARWPVERGVLRLTEGNDPFYEGAYTAQVHLATRQLQSIRGRLLLPFVSFGYLKAVVDAVRPAGDLLELGCGSGCVLFGERFRVTAVDLSFHSLVGTPPRYTLRVQANATDLDFPEGSFDGIAASCFWEHLQVKQKEALLAKMRTWLKPEGRLILLFDTASQNPLFRWFRAEPDLYQQCFVEHDGHVGLESAEENLDGFRRAGFSLRHGIGLNRTIQHLPVYTWMAPYGAANRWARWLSAVGCAVGRNAVSLRGFTAAVHVWDLTAGRAFPTDWSRLYLGIWERAAQG
jgi:SAM-dependent methyltransferase